MDRSTLVTPDGLLERGREVEHVRAAVRAVGQRGGRALVVEGPAGIGKSRLLEVARARASHPLLEALALAARCGAKSIERRSRGELAAIGLRPRTAARSGTDSLTPSERRVVEIEASGSTNREIAQTLFVTEKTVETHLGQAFCKLDITSRRQLPELLARDAD
jgi:DNA-binding NarL/FixJ family response regulator